MSSVPFDFYDPKMYTGISGILTFENDELVFSLKKENLAIKAMPVATEEVRIRLDQIAEVRSRSFLGNHKLTLIPRKLDLFKNFGEAVGNELVLYVRGRNKTSMVKTAQEMRLRLADMEIKRLE
jgi:hypothetical protein